MRRRRQRRYASVGHRYGAGPQHLEALAAALATAAKASRQAIEIADDLDDEVTADLFNEINAALDKDLWFIEAHLQ